MFDNKGGVDPTNPLAAANNPVVAAVPTTPKNTEKVEEIFVSVQKIKQLNTKLSIRNNYAHFQEIYQLLQELRKKTQSSGELRPDLQIVVNYQGQVQPQELYTINIEKILKETKKELIFDPNKTLFNLDVVRILTGVARLFHQVDPNLVPGYSAEDQLDLVLLREWLQPETVEKSADAFDEVTLVRKKIHELKKLLDAVLRAAEIYKQDHAPANLSQFILSEEMKSKLYSVFAEELAQLLPDYKEIDWNTQAQARSELITAILKQLSDDDLFTAFFQTLIPELNALQLHDPTLGRFDPNLLEKEWFSRPEQQARRKSLRDVFITRHGQRIATAHIVPLLKKPAASKAAGAEPSEASDDAGGADAQIEPTLVPSSNFPNELLSAAIHSLADQLTTLITAEYDVVRTFDQSRPGVVHTWLYAELPNYVQQTEVLSREFTNNFQTLLAKYGGFFQSTTDPQTGAIQYSVSVGLIEQPELQAIIARYVTQQIPTVKTAVEAPLFAYISSQQRPQPQAGGQKLTQQRFIAFIADIAQELLLGKLMESISATNDVVRNFARTDNDYFRSLIKRRAPQAVSDPDFFENYITANWMQLIAEHGGFFQAQSTQSQAATEYTVAAGFAQQQVMVDLLNQFVNTQLPIVLAAIQQEIVAHIEWQVSFSGTTEDAVPPTTEVATAAVVVPEQSDQTQTRTTLEPEAQTKLFLATQQLLANSLLFPVANNLNTNIDDFDPVIRDELRLAANRFLLDQKKDLRLTASERIKLIQEFQKYLLTTHAGSSTNGRRIVELFSNNKIVSLYAAFDSDLKRIAQFDNVASTVILKQKIDAFILEADEKALSTIKGLDLTTETDLNRFFQIIQLPVGIAVTAELTKLFRDHPQVQALLINYITARIPELDAAVHARQQRKKTGSTSEKALLLQTEQTAQVHRLVQAVSSAQRFQSDGSEAEIVGSAVGKSGRENLLTKANWLLKQNEQQYGFIWRSLTEEQQRAIYAELSRITGAPLLITGQFAVGAGGLPPPADIALANIPEILRQLGRSLSDAEYARLKAEYDKIEKSKENDEYKRYQYAEDLGTIVVTTFIDELPQEVLQLISAQYALELNQLSALLSYEQLLEAALTAEDQLVTQEESTPEGLSRFIPGRRRRSIDGSVQKASKKTFSKAEDMAYKAGKMALSATGAGAVASRAISLLERTIGEENTKKLIKYGVPILGIGTALATIAALLKSAWARWGASAGSLIGGAVGSVIPAIGTVAGAASGFALGALGGFAAEQIKNGILNGAAAAPAAPAHNAVLPKHAVQPRFAPHPPAGTAPVGGAQAVTTQGAARLSALAPAKTAATSGMLTTAKGALASAAGLPIAVLAPGLMIATTFLVGFLTVFIIFSAFLIPIPGGGSSGGYTNPPLAGFEGCWPTTGRISQYRTNIYQGVKSDHLVVSTGINAVVDAAGTVQYFKGKGSAIDIAYVGGYAFPGGPPLDPPSVYAPFSGFASFYPMGHGIQAGKNFGNHIVLVTPSFVLILAHLENFGQSLGSGISDEVPTHKQVVAGQLLGIMGNTGNSTGMHLHYEVIGLDILQVLPLSPADRAKYDADEESFQNVRVSALECAIPGTGDGYVAIGPATNDNIFVSTTEEIAAPPVTTCSWRSSSGLAAATNANFYNTPYTPIGIAGTNPSAYYANAFNRPITFINQLQSLVVTSAGGVQVLRPDPILAQSLVFPVTLPQFSKGVTGIYAEGGSDKKTDNRTALGLGVSNGVCESAYSGQKAIFLAAMPEVTYDQIEAELARCGATQFIHFDGGSSTAFCSESLNIDPRKVVPVHVGLKKASIFRSSAGATLPSPSP